ncbi:hypothetical protein AN643_04115 [Candidatus Epulonipiscioides saccharophilum]|nr:hypothetical protein AN643_04115 [Epulopiscium sp. SCG-B10WGA-EpuloB]
MEIKVKLTFVDIFRYNLNVGYKSIFSKVILLIGFLLLALLIYNFSIAQGPFLDIVSKNIILIIVVFLALLSKFIKIWKITAMQATTPTFQEIFIYKFSSDSIYLQYGDNSDTVLWNIYEKVEETKNDFRFFVDSVQAQIVPKHCLKNADELNSLREIIEQALPEEKYTLKKYT